MVAKVNLSALRQFGFIWVPEDKDGDCVEYCVVHHVVIGE